MNEEGLLKHKIIPPKPQKFYIDRKRLIELLNNGGTHGALIIAPAGYGKTALVSQFYSNLPRNMKCWLNLDPEDSEPARFKRYFIGALSKQLKSLASSGLVEQTQNDDVRLDDIARDLLLYFDQYKGAPVWFTLDNWERVNDSKEICSFVEKLTGIPDSRLKMIVSSRIKPAFRFQRKQEMGQLTVIAKDTLRFTKAELSSAIERRTGATLDEKRLDEFHRATKGWCVIAGLLRDRIAEAGADILFHPSRLTDTDELEDYLLQEVFSEYDPEFYDFLVRCSLLDTLTQESCQIVLDNGDSIDRTLRQVRQSSLPYTVIDENAVRLHPLIKKSLTETLKRTYDPSVRNSVYQKVADYYLNVGEIDLAIELLFDIDAYEDAFAIIKERWHVLMSRGKLARIDDWLNRTPVRFQNLPDYLMVFADFHNQFGNFNAIYDKARPLIEGHQLEDGSDALGILWCLYHQCIAVMDKGNNYDHFKRQWEKLNKSRGPFSSLVNMRVHDLLGLTSFHEFRYNEMKYHAERALSYADKDDVFHNEDFEFKRRFSAHYLGDSRKATETLRQVQSTSSEDDPFPYFRTMFLEVFLTEMGLYRKALDVIKHRREEMDRHGFYEKVNILLFDRCEGICNFHLGNIGRGLTLLESAMNYAKHYWPPYYPASLYIYNYYRMLTNRPVDYSLIPEYQDRPVVSVDLFYAGLLRSYRLIREGDYTEARKWIRQLGGIAKKNRIPPWIMIISFWEALLNEKSGNRRPVKSQVRKGAEILNKIEWSSFPMINSELISSIIAWSIIWGIRIDCISELKNICNRSDLQKGFDYFLSKTSLTGEQRSRLIKWATEHGIGNLSQSVKKYMNSANDQLSSASKRYIDTVGSFPLPPMVISTLGSYSINIDGRIISFGRKKSKLLFSILLANHPDQVHEEQLIEILLSGKQTSRPKSNIRTIASSLRKSLMLGSEDAISYLEHSDNMYSLNIPERSSIDFMEIDKLYRKTIDSKLGSSTISESDVQQIKNVLGLYRGDFLPEYRYEEFSVIIGERTRNQYFHLLSLLLEHLLNIEDYALAEKYVLEGLERDPFWDYGVKLAIRLYHTSGKSIKAIKLYREYEKRLDNELGVEPSKAIRTLYERLLF